MSLHPDGKQPGGIAPESRLHLRSEARMARFEKTLDFCVRAILANRTHCASRVLRNRSGFCLADFLRWGGLMSENPVLLPLRGFNELETPPPVRASVPTGDRYQL